MAPRSRLFLEFSQSWSRKFIMGNHLKSSGNLWGEGLHDFYMVIAVVAECVNHFRIVTLVLILRDFERDMSIVESNWIKSTIWKTQLPAPYFPCWTQKSPHGIQSMSSFMALSETSVTSTSIGDRNLVGCKYAASELAIFHDDSSSGSGAPISRYSTSNGRGQLHVFLTAGQKRPMYVNAMRKVHTTGIPDTLPQDKFPIKDFASPTLSYHETI